MGYEENKKSLGLTYGILDKPPWPSSVVFGLQHFLAAFSGIFGAPLIIVGFLCLGDNEYGYVLQSKVISSMFFSAGLSTFLQASIGCRLPILQGASFAFVVPAIALLSSERFSCDIPTTSEDNEYIWKSRMQTLQGGMIAASLVEICIGMFGLVGFLMKFIGPLTIAPVLISIGMSLVDPTINYCSGNWAIAAIVMFILILCSNVLHNVNIPWLSISIKERKIRKTQVLFFRLYPIIIAIVVGIIFCAIFTAENVFPVGDASRTDNGRISGIAKSPWIFFPYPGQWGTPKFHTSAIVGMISGAMASILESIGDYYSAAKLSAAPPLPQHAVNRGIMIEGLGCLWAGLIGSGVGVTSYSGNIGALGVTKNGSTRCMFTASILLLILGICPKVSACFLWIPKPIIGGVYAVMCALPAAVGMSLLNHVNLNSSRNQFVVGFAVFVGIMIPRYISSKPNAIKTQSQEFNELCNVLLRTGVFVAGFFGALFDNILPGDIEERGLLRWRETSSDDDDLVNMVYGYPVNRFQNVFKRIPFMPNYRKMDATVNSEPNPSSLKDRRHSQLTMRSLCGINNDAISL